MNPLALVPVLLCPIIGLIVFVAIIMAILRAIRGPRNVIVSSMPIDIGTVMDADGFWLDDCSAVPGSMVHFHYWANGIRYAGQAPWQPGPDGRQFVYTGIRPEQVAILQIVGLAGGFDSGFGASVIDTSAESGPIIDVTPDFSSPPPSGGSGFPSAY